MSLLWTNHMNGLRGNTSAGERIDGKEEEKWFYWFQRETDSESHVSRDAEPATRENRAQNRISSEAKRENWERESTSVCVHHRGRLPWKLSCVLKNNYLFSRGFACFLQPVWEIRSNWENRRWEQVSTVFALKLDVFAQQYTRISRQFSQKSYIVKYCKLSSVNFVVTVIAQSIAYRICLKINVAPSSTVFVLCSFPFSTW